MSESSTPEIPCAVRVYGAIADAGLDAAGHEFADHFYSVAAAAGIETIADPFDRDLDPFGRAGQLVAGRADPTRKGLETSQDLLIAASLFVGSSAGAWAVEKACDLVWDRMRTGIRKLVAAVHAARRPAEREGRVEQENPAGRMVFTTVYSQGSHMLLVEVELTLDGASMLDPVLDPEAMAGLVVDLQRRGAVEGSAGGLILRYHCRGLAVGEPERTPLDEGNASQRQTP